MNLTNNSLSENASGIFSVTSESQSSIPVSQPQMVSSHSHYHSHRRSVIHLPKFCWEPQEFIIFISTLKDHVKFEQWPDNDLLNAAHHSLEGFARQFYIEWQEISPFQSSEELFDALTNFFKTENSSKFNQQY